MSHSRWNGLTALPDPRGRENQLNYVDGYALALEDMFKEMAQIPLEGELRQYRKEVRRRLSEMLESTRRTRSMLEGRTVETDG